LFGVTTRAPRASAAATKESGIFVEEGGRDRIRAFASAADHAWLAQLVTRRVPMGEWPKALERGSDDVKVVVDLQAG